MDANTGGLEAFDLLVRLISRQFDPDDGHASFNRFQAFGVSNGIPSPYSLRPFCVLVPSLTGSKNVLAPNVSIVLEFICGSGMSEHPGLMLTLHSGELVSVLTPFVTIDAICLVFQNHVNYGNSRC